MVQYWRNGDIARAKLSVLKDGSYAMIIEGEKYPLYGFPRGPILFGPLARLKYLAKNLIFNQPWKLLEEGKSNEEVFAYIRNVAMPEILREIDKSKYDFFPPERMCPAMRELWRAMHKLGSGRAYETLIQGITFFFQEDDAYRFRFQWIAQYADPKNIFRRIYRFITRKPYSLKEELRTLMNFINSAEVVPDMKGRINLIMRITLLLLENKEILDYCEKLAMELDWNKLKLSKSDKYYFRGKYFKVDHDKFDY